MGLRDKLMAGMARQCGRPEGIRGRLIARGLNKSNRGFVVAAVAATNTVYFVEDLERAFAELARVLHPGGRLVVGVADPAVMEKMPITAHGFRIRGSSQLRV